MRYEPQDFARCNGNPAFGYCKQCLRSNAPVHPDATRSVWLGVWVMEDERCPSFVEIEMTEHQKKMERDAAERKAFAAKPTSRHLWWR